MGKDVLNNITERIGIHRVALCFLEKFGWIEREQYVADFGIDTQVEIVENNRPTGLLYCIQVKAGDSYINKNGKSITYYTDAKHANYWQNHSLPVILIICDIKKNNNYWTFIDNKSLTKTESRWKVNIPLENLLDSDDSIDKIRNYYFTNTNFTIMESGIDTSHGLCRRMSMKIVLKKPVSKIIIQKQAPQLIEGLKKSDYYRSKIVERHFKDKPVDCVWIWFYKNVDQYKNGLPFCTAYWNDPNLKSPTILKKTDEVIDGISFNWSNVEISDYLLEKKLSKGRYLKIIDNYILSAKKIFTEISDIYIKHKCENLDYLKNEILKYKEKHEILLPEEYHQNFPPLECNDLDQCVQNINCSMDNIFIILSDKNRGEENIYACVEMYMEKFINDLQPFDYERGKVV